MMSPLRAAGFAYLLSPPSESCMAWSMCTSDVHFPGTPEAGEEEEFVGVQYVVQRWKQPREEGIAGKTVILRFARYGEES